MACLANLFHLEELHWNGIPRISQQHQSLIPPSLKTLTLGSICLENSLGVITEQLPRLESVGSIAEITEQLIAHIKKLKHLRELKLRTRSN